MDAKRLRNSRSTWIRSALVSVLLVLGLASCGGGSEQSDASSIPGEQDASTITILAVDASDVENAPLKAIAEAYEAQRNGVQVEITFVPEDTIEAKLQTAVLADAPDLVTVYSTNQIWQLQPLDDLVFTEHDIDVSGLNGTLQSICEFENQIYCAGSYVGSMALVYNKDLFDAADVPYPDSSTPLTIDEYAAIAEELTQRGSDGATTVFGGDATIDPAAYLGWDNYFDDTGRIVEATNPALVSTLQTFAAMVADGRSPSVAQVQAAAGDGASSLFLQEQLAMFVGGVESDQAESAGINWGAAPQPYYAGGQPWVSTWTNALGIPEKAANAQGAADFLAFMVTKGQETQATFPDFMPMQTSAAQQWASTDQQKQYVALVGNAAPGVFNPAPWAVVGPISDAFAQALLGGPVESLLEDAQPKAQEINDTIWEQFDQARAAASS